MCEYINKSVKIVTTSKTIIEGRVFTIDPVSCSFILYSIQNDSSKLIMIVLGFNISSIEIIDDNKICDSDVSVEEINHFFSKGEADVCSQNQVSVRKMNLIKWFNSHFIPVEISTVDENILIVGNQVQIAPPYTKNDCLHTNSIIFGRISKLVEDMPDNL
ncbi:hypothetical protein HELRODRAFT_85978 [Helobdella robusta]|uniref:AD domain-containing protein n=1 Tax=Helobdella robusta TaxID=6412 RepID=T1G655_HELRO|nr:hypothetical protein HELRODRAFT_85978 [Helobdella robusta]ESN96934.1 hypothetical protein HELRODRAFT_85978 [Helobdella robusta]